jgi:hypothetical protein
LGSAGQCSPGVETRARAPTCMTGSTCKGAQAMEIQQDGGVELLPGFRFHPTDEELLSYYLTKKISNRRSAISAIIEVDLNKCEPWDLPGIQHMHLLLFGQIATSGFSGETVFSQVKDSLIWNLCISS